MSAAAGRPIPKEARLKIRPALFAVLFTLPLLAAPNAQPLIPRAGETIDVSIVDFDVIVTDSRGHRVHGLTRDDFEVFEDKKPQPITNFAEYGGATHAREKRTIVLFIEVAPDQTFRIKETFDAMKKTLREIVAPGDSVTIAAWSDAPVIALHDSDDPAAIEATLDGIARESVTRGFRFPAAYTPFDPFTRTPSMIESFPRYHGDRLELEARRPYGYQPDPGVMRDQAAAINSLINSVADEGGRKAFFLMSRSIGPIDRGDYFYEIERRGVPLWHDYYRNNEIVNTIKATAAARNVPMYVFPVGPPLSAAMSSPFMGGFSDPTHGAVWDPNARYDLEKIYALRDIAKASGGMYATGSDIARSMPRVREDLSDYYSLAYRVSARNDNRVRNVVVKAKNPEYSIRTRKQYIEKDDDIRVRDQVIASLFAEPAPSGIAVDAVIGQPVRKGRRRTSIPISVVMPAKSFMTADNKGAFSVYVATGHNIGSASDITKRTVAFSSEDMTKAPSGKFEYQFELQTDADANLLSVAVYDEVSHDSGFARVDLPKVRQ